MIDFLESFQKLKSYCEKEEYKGWDPYDIQNSILPIKVLPHKLQFVVTQIFKKSPINFRKILGVKKQYFNKALGLFLSGYSNLYIHTRNELFLEKAQYLFGILISNKSKVVDNLAWGYDFNFSNRYSLCIKDTPTVIHHSYALKGINDYYKATKSEDALKIILEFDKFIIENIPLNKFENGLCFGYYPGAEGCCYNASLHAAEVLAIVNQHKKNEIYEDLIENAVKYVISRQKEDGKWYYSHLNNPNIEKNQIDFHQGFIVESLLNINDLTNKKFNSLIAPSILNGLEFYLKKQFDSIGRSIYRYPQKFPIDIHNQAQGIITFSLFSTLSNEYKVKSRVILEWTIKNMQSSKGFFYFEKHKLFTNKTPYIRWSQAWMFVAFVNYFIYNNEINYLKNGKS